MLAKLQQTSALFSEADAGRARHVLALLPAAKLTSDVPHRAALEAALARRGKKAEELTKSPVTAEARGALVSWAIDDRAKPVFERQTLIRKALQPLLAEHPAELAIAVFGAPD